MPSLGLKLGRHSVQAGLWSEDLGRPLEAHLPGLEGETSWTPVLSREGAGKLGWGEDLWAQLHQQEPLEESLPERLRTAVPAEVTELQLLLSRILWPEVAALARKELRGTGPGALGLALTVAPAAPLPKRLSRSLPETLALAWCGSAAAAAVAAAAAEWGPGGGTVLHAHLGGSAARVSAWEVSRPGERFLIRERAALEDPEAGLAALLGRVYERVSGDWGLLRVEAPESAAEAELVRRVRRDVLRRLAEGRANWEVAWQYEVGPDFRRLVQWTHPGPARLPADGLQDLLQAGQARLAAAVDRVLHAAELRPDQVLHVVATGRGAAEDYYLPALQQRFGRKRCPRRRDAETLPALGAAALARHPESWTIEITPTPHSPTSHEPQATTTPQPATSNQQPATNLPTSPDPRSHDPRAHEPRSHDPRFIGLALAISTDRASVAWKEHGRPGAAEAVPLQGRPVVSTTVAVERARPEVRFWGPAAERLRGEAERYAVIPDLPAHCGTGVRFVLTRGAGGPGAPSLAPEDLFTAFTASVLQEAEKALGRAGAPAGSPLLAVALPPSWPEPVAEAARRELRLAAGRRVRRVSAPLAALLSSFPPPSEERAAVLLVDGEGYSAARLERDPSDALGWRVAAESHAAGYAARFCAEVLARFLTDELNGRFARGYRYAALISAPAGSEERSLGEALREGGDELAERLVRSARGTVRLELRLPGGGTALFEATATREQWDAWAGRRVREAIGGVLGEVLAPPAPRRLVLAGTGTPVPLLVRAAGEFCRDLGVSVELHPQPELAVALGAALAAAEWAAAVNAAGAPEVALLAGAGERSLAEGVRDRMQAAGVRAEVLSPGAGDAGPRLLVFLVGSAPPDPDARQELEWMLRNGIPVLPLRVPAATPGPASPLDTLSPAAQEEVDRLTRIVQGLLTSLNSTS